MKLNLGCGSDKIEDFINIDMEHSCKPDVVCDFARDKLPYEDGEAEEVVIFHTVEHITKRLHPRLFKEIHRVLKKEGKLLVSYPEFTRCYERWKSNTNGHREFWEATIFGRQLYPSDYHVCIMHTPIFTNFLREQGFKNISVKQEPKPNEFNSVVTAFKGIRNDYETQVKTFVECAKFKRMVSRA